MARFDSFTDLAEHYASLTSADAFAGAFTSEITASQLSIHDEPTADDLPDAAAARIVAAHVTGEIFNLFADTRLAAIAPRIAWGIVNSFHKVAQQLSRQEDDAARELGELARIMDPSEIHAVKIEEAQRLCQSLHEAIAAIEAMRDHAAEVYRVENGHPWSATTGSRTSRALTASQIDARDFLAARAAEKREAHAPSGPVVVLSGGQDWGEHQAIWDRLDAIKSRIPAMTLVTTAQHKGADAIGAAWAAARGVPLVAFRLNRQLGNRAGFERNRSLVRLLPVEAVICEGSGLQINLAQGLRAADVPLTIFKHEDFAIGDQARPPPPGAGGISAMRFTPHQGIYAYERTNRKLKAAERRLRLDREKFPLFADEIGESQPSPEELLDARARSFVTHQQDNRDRAARNWWQARAELRAIPEPDRAAFIRYWNRCKCPGNATYLLTYMNMFRDGRLIVHEGEVRPRSDVEWERDRKAKIAAMNDLELDVMIQTHISPLFAEWGREERRRRATVEECPKPDRARTAKRRGRGGRG